MTERPETTPDPQVVLVVDAITAMRQTTTQTLAGAGYRVWEADTVQHALLRAAAHPDLIILHLDLPDGSGLELCRSLKAATATGAIPVLLISAQVRYGQEYAGCLEAGAETCLVHPVDPGVLLATVRSLLRASQTERRLRESQEQFRIVAENARAVFGIIQGTKFVYANPYLAELTGYSLPELYAMDYVQVIRPDYHQRMLDYARRRELGEPLPIHYEFPLITRDGRTRWMAFSPGRIEYNGRPAIVGTAYDITDRKEAEEALRRSEAKYRAVFEQAALGIGRVRFSDARWIDVNDAFCRMLGYNCEQLLAIPWPEITHPDDVERNLTLFRRLAAGELNHYSFEKRFIHKDGHHVWARLTLSLVRDPQGRPDYEIAIIEDVSERKRVQDALQQSESRLRVFVEYAPAALAMFDRQMRYLSVSHRWLSDYGLQGRDLTGMSHYAIFPDIPERWRDVHRRALAGEVVRSEADPFPRADGSLQWLRWEVRPWYDAAGNVAGIVIFSEDITARKRAEEDLAAAKVSAEQAKAVAEEASHAKDHFLAVLSHELRTPLTPVVTALSMLQNKGVSDPAARENLDMIRRNVEMETRLIDDLLDVTRIARGKIDIHRRPVELREVVQRAVEVVQPDIEARQLHFTLHLPDVPCIVHADAVRLQQVFWNLLRNAIKFTPHGGCVSLRAWKDGPDHVVVEVTDSGEGMEPDALARIFNAFEQAERSITRQFGGLGLGLAISKALVDLHGGTIEASSPGKGKGATFRVHLPVAAGQLPQAAPFAAPAPVTRPLTILLVEDHGDTARVMRQLLMREGHKVERAGDVATALDMARRQKFDLLISDLGLPDRSGLELMRDLLASGWQAPAIALSGYGQEEDIRRSREAGFATHLTKPTSPERLAEAIASLAAPS